MSTSSSSEEEEEEKEEKKKQKSAPSQKKNVTYAAPNSSIVCGPETIDTVAGPVHEWLCCKDNLPNHPTMVFFGKRRTGKSTTITNILYHCCQEIPFGIVMSDTAYAGKCELLTVFSAWHSFVHLTSRCVLREVECVRQ